MVFHGYTQERQDEVRKQLQLSMDFQSEKLNNVIGWSRIENQEGKFWKKSEPNSGISYLPEEEGEDGIFSFEFFQLYQFSVEEQNFYLLSLKYNDTRMRIFAFNSSDVQNLKEIIDNADGKTYDALEIRYCSYIMDSEVSKFDPEKIIKDKQLIKLLLLGKGDFYNSNWCKGNSFFKLNSQILKGEKIIRFLYIPWDGWDKYNLWGMTSKDLDLSKANGYFELKKSEFEKLFKFSPYESESKYIELGNKNMNLEDYSEAIKEFTKALSVNENNYHTYMNLGYCKINLHDYSGAINDYSKAIELSSHIVSYVEKEDKEKAFDTSCFNRAFCRYQLGDIKGTLGDLDLIKSTSFSSEEIVADLRSRALLKLASHNIKLNSSDSNENKETNGGAKETTVGENSSFELEEDEVFMVAEEMPEFPGGRNALNSYIAKSVVYPAVSKEKGIQGKVFVSFVINKSGSVANAKVVRGVDYNLDAEALRVVSSLPKWKPGKSNGVPVRVSETVSVLFSLGK